MSSILRFLRDSFLLVPVNLQCRDLADYASSACDGIRFGIENQQVSCWQPVTLLAQSLRVYSSRQNWCCRRPWTALFHGEASRCPIIPKTLRRNFRRTNQCPLYAGGARLFVPTLRTRFAAWSIGGVELHNVCDIMGLEQNCRGRYNMRH